jgi:carbon monoxide dehydrogenase subunit G
MRVLLVVTMGVLMGTATGGQTGRGAMQKSPYTTTVTIQQVVGGKVGTETKDVQAFRRDSDGVVKWQLNGKQVKVSPKIGDRIVDDQGTSWLVGKVLQTTGGERVICEVTKLAAKKD